MLEKNKQEASNINDSFVQQANGDIYNYGLAYNDVKEICRDVIRQEFQIVTKEAVDKFNRIIEEFQNRLIEKLAELKDQTNINKFKEPQYQFILHDTMKEYAQSDDELLKAELIDILIDRLQVKDNSTLRHVIENAIQILPKLTLPTSQLLGAMYLRFLKERCSANLFPDKIESYAEIYENLDQVTNFDIEYLKQLNCCTTLLDLKHMEPIETEMRTKYDYYFRKPIKIEEIQKFFNSYNSLTSDLEVFPYFIDESNNNQYKCIFINIESMRDNLQKIGKAHLIPVINSFLTTIPTQADAEIKEKLISINSNWEKAINIFQQENVWVLQPTPVGMYIAWRIIKRTNIRIGNFTLDNLY